MKEDTATVILETVVAMWLLAIAFVLFLTPFVVIGMVVMYLWGAL